MLRSFLVTLALLLSGQLSASSAYLFTYKANKITPALAKSVTRVSDSSYRVNLDTSKKVEGASLTAEMVKNSLEAKLAKMLGLQAKITNPSTLTLSFKGSEKKFLTRVSRTKISKSPQKGMELASAVSDSSIRAKTGSKGVGPQQIEIKVTQIGPKTVTGLVLKVGSDFGTQIKKGRKLTLHGIPKPPVKKSAKVQVKVEKKGDNWWLVQ